MERASVTYHDYEVEIFGSKRRERLKISGDYPKSQLAESVFSQLGLMHLVAPYLPEQIRTNFWVSDPMRRLIGAMYRSEKRGMPCFIFNIDADNDTGNSQPGLRTHSRTHSGRAVVAYSAGKDSMWNMWWAQEKYGRDNVMAIHIGGLNRSNGSKEREYAARQARELGFKNFRTIDLLNSSQNTGYQIMRSRDMFLVGVIIPIALEFGASKIITEGFSETGPDEPFTGQEKSTIYFNKILREMGIPVRVVWRNRNEMDVLKDLFTNHPDWLPHVCNCFSVPCYQPNLRRSWKRRAPTFKLYDSQCGSCVKCRITNLGRIFYDPKTRNVSVEDICVYLRNTAEWIRVNGERLKDVIGGSFMRDFRGASKKYGL